jgi:NADH-quinone oxidoreductase subunit F
VEAAYGTTLSQILELLNNDPHAVKAFIMGGLGSAFLPKDFINLPLTHSALVKAGSGIGSGRILVIDQQHSILDITRYAVEKEINRSHGHKLPCREVLQTILLILNKVPSGLTQGDLLILKNTAESLKKNARCDSVRLTSSPILSGLKYFEEEFTGRHPLETALQLS